MTVTGDFHILDFSFNVTEIDCTANPDFKFDKEDHSIEFPGYVALVGGEIVNILQRHANAPYDLSTLDLIYIIVNSFCMI